MCPPTDIDLFFCSVIEKGKERQEGPGSEDLCPQPQGLNGEWWAGLREERSLMDMHASESKQRSMSGGRNASATRGETKGGGEENVFYSCKRERWLKGIKKGIKWLILAKHEWIKQKITSLKDVWGICGCRYFKSVFDCFWFMVNYAM